ncbi:DUF2835 family protein [Alteromonas halophila]|uniref:DUF2835 family protein n=1 Tax=Alteromonas halophila TaxID=516698 RepID=A0A918JLR6_9ALTE|nr:DUF2835 family protein [Alteromonas halophila]GGW88508.1 hypothetical protein GCM10007391_23160 [Alteromonas halophila]
MTTPAATDTVYYFSVRVSYIQCEALYQSPPPPVVLTDDRGVRVQVPAVCMRQFVTSTGIRGRFRLIVDKSHKIRSFERVT